MCGSLQRRRRCQYENAKWRTLVIRKVKENPLKKLNLGLMQLIKIKINFIYVRDERN